jgi:hypothetical protein
MIVRSESSAANALRKHFAFDRSLRMPEKRTRWWTVALFKMIDVAAQLGNEFWS